MPLTLTKRPRSPFYYIRGTINGVTVFESTKTSEKRIAEAYLAEYQSRLVKQSRSFDTITFGDAVASYLQFGGQERFIDRILEALGDIPLSMINQAVIDRAASELFKGYRRQPGGKIYNYNPSSIKRAFYVPVAAVMHHAAERSMCPLIRIKMPKTVRPAPKWAEIDYLQKLWAVCDKDLLALAKFLPLTGCRIQECLDLTWADVNLDEGWAWIKQTKTDEPRMVHLPPDLVDCLRAVQKDEGKVFIYNNRNNVRWVLRVACKKAGIEYLSSHKLGSHTYATLMRRYAGMDARGLVATGRWKSEASTHFYTHTRVSEEAKKSNILSTRAQIRAL